MKPTTLFKQPVSQPAALRGIVDAVKDLHVLRELLQNRVSFDAAPI